MKTKFQCERDNLIISGTEYRNTDQNQKSLLPAIILSHGYLANQKTCKDYALLAADQGYAAFTFDFNGGGIFSKSSGKSVNMTVETEVEDLVAVINYVRKLPYVDPSDITLLGCSQGGVVSALTAKKEELDIKNLILFYPALCIPDDARAGKMMFAKFDPVNVPDVIQRFPMKLGGDYAKCVNKWQVSDIVGGFDRPVLLLHGTEDKVVNIKYAREAVKEYAQVEYHEIIGGEHGFKKQHDVEAKGYLKEFLNRTHQIYDPSTLKPVIKSSICTGEKVAGFQNLQTGKFEDVMLVRTGADLEKFKEIYGISGDLETIY